MLKLQISACIFVALLTEFKVHSELNNKTSYELCVDGFEVFNCSGAGFVEVPPPIHIPNYMKQLDLSNNLIQNISFINYTILGRVLEVLILRGNQITYMQRDGFELFTNLSLLDLSSNNIRGENIDERVFNDLQSLKTLRLGENPIGIIKETTFNFMELPQLRYLDLSHCLIGKIEPTGIDLPNLIHLDLSWNQLEILDPDAFRMLVELRTLDLSRNKFKVFDHLPYLPEIRTINMDSNFIETVNISEDVWKLADSLERLYMRNNDIIRFTKDNIPFDLQTLVEIRLENNKIQCDCRMRWIKGENYDFTKRNISIPCQYPVQLRGVNLLDVQSDDLSCSAPLWEILLLSGLIIVGLIVVGMSIYVIVKKKCKRKMTRKSFSAGDEGGNYTAVFTKDDDDMKVAINDDRALLQSGKEFDV